MRSLIIIYIIYILLLLLLYIGIYTMHFSTLVVSSHSQVVLWWPLLKKIANVAKIDPPDLLKVGVDFRPLLAVETPCHMAPTS